MPTFQCWCSFLAKATESKMFPHTAPPRAQVQILAINSDYIGKTSHYFLIILQIASYYTIHFRNWKRLSTLKITCNVC
jgi:hypothetical protein